MTTNIDTTEKSYSDKVIAAVLNKIDGRPFVCAVCGSNDWRAQKYMGFIPASETLPDVLSRVNTSFPVAMVVCVHCGYALFFNLIELGLGEDMNLLSVG